MKIEKDTHNISHVQKDLSLARTHKSSMDTRGITTGAAPAMVPRAW